MSPSSPRAGWTACSSAGRPARGSCSRVPERMAAARALRRGRPRAARRRRPLRRPDDRRDGRARRPRRRGGGRRRRGDPAAVLPRSTTRRSPRTSPLAAAACAPRPFYAYEFAARSGYAIPLAVIERLRRARAEPARAQGLRHALGGARAVPARGARRLRRRRVAARPRRSRRAPPGPSPGSPPATPRSSPRSSPSPSAENAAREAERLRGAARALPLPGRLQGRRRAARRPDRARRPRAAAHAHRRRARGARAAVILVAGAGAVGASVAYQLALQGARGVVLCDRGGVGGGSTSKAMGGVRQQFSTAADVALARESVAFLARVRTRALRAGRLPLPRDERRRASPSSSGAARSSSSSACRSSASIPPSSPGSPCDDVLGAVFCAADGVADPLATTRELVRRAAELGVEVAEQTDAGEPARRRPTRSSSPAGPGRRRSRRRRGSSSPSRRSAASCSRPRRSPGCPQRLPMVVESESGFHFRRRGERLVLAMADAAPRYGLRADASRRRSFDDRLERLARALPARGRRPRRGAPGRGSTT